MPGHPVAPRYSHERGRLVERQELTEREYWDSRWEKVELPAEVTRDSRKFVTRDLIGLFDKYLPKGNGLRILEIGGAPGKWLAYFKKNFHYDIAGIDYSPTGCQKMRKNFDLLHLGGSVFNNNILTDDLSALPRFDVVYSFGFVEHFDDLDLILEKHLAMLRPEGILMVGMPNFLGITHRILKRTAPRILSTHNLRAMDLRTWERLEKKYRLQPIFKGYVGGFDLHNCRRCEKRTLLNRIIRVFFKILTRVTGRMSFLRRFPSQYWSPYLLVMYRKK